MTNNLWEMHVMVVTVPAKRNLNPSWSIPNLEAWFEYTEIIGDLYKAQIIFLNRYDGVENLNVDGTISIQERRTKPSTTLPPFLEIRTLWDKHLFNLLLFYYWQISYMQKPHFT